MIAQDGYNALDVITLISTNIHVASLLISAGAYIDCNRSHLLCPRMRGFVAQKLLYVSVRAMCAQRFSERAVLNELYHVCVDDIGMVLYCNPAAVLSVSDTETVSPQWRWRFHVSKDIVRDVLRCVRTVWQRQMSRESDATPQKSDYRRSVMSEMLFLHAAAFTSFD